MKTYKGSRFGDMYQVTVDGQPLPLRLDLRIHSPTGFAWGYGGSAPAQLSLALLADHTGSDAEAVHSYMRFREVVAGLQEEDGQPISEWEMTSDDMDAALSTIARSRSTTWPHVGKFAVEMERQLSLHRERGDRPGWLAQAPSELASAVFEQLEKLSHALLMWDPRKPQGGLSREQLRTILKHCAHIGNFAMMVADSVGALGEPARGERPISELEALDHAEALAVRSSALTEDLASTRAASDDLAQRLDAEQRAHAATAYALAKAEVALRRWVKP